MRVYLPSTVSRLRLLLDDGHVPPGPAYAVTPALREGHRVGDTEELEYIALLAAARASLDLLAGEPAVLPRRVVVTADVPDRSVRAGAGAGHPGQVDVLEHLPLSAVASVHVDDGEAQADVAAAVAALPAAGRGDMDARERVEDTEGHELLWYATQEIGHLLGTLAG